MRMLRPTALIIAAGLALAACGGGTGSAEPTAAPTAAPSAAAPSAATSDGPTVNLGETTLGSVLVDGQGMTLYIFTADTGGTSACTGDCLANWPVLAGGTAPTLGAGLDAADFGTITRPDDGSAQVTFNGMPLYYFAGDAAAGDVSGQGLAEKWYVIGADGTPVK